MFTEPAVPQKPSVASPFWLNFRLVKTMNVVEA
jgi:hypothetical protein